MKNAQNKSKMDYLFFLNANKSYLIFMGKCV